MCLTLLLGRYDWSAPARFVSIQGYLSSAYLLMVLLPCLYYLSKALGRHSLALVLTVTTAVVFTLPYRWLGLARFYYYAERPEWYTLGSAGQNRPVADWFPSALDRLPCIPGEFWFFLGLGLLGAAVCAATMKRRHPDLSSHQRRLRLGALGLYGLILLQTWLHLSMRSPYTYIPHYEQPLAANYWYVSFLFPDGRGAVNADYPVFRALEQLFVGVPLQASNCLIRRALPAFVSAQFSYFANCYYVYLLLNTAAWFAAAVCGYLFVRRVFGDTVATYTAVLIATGPAFVMYVAQPMSYVSGYAIIPILVYLFQRVVIEAEPHPGRFILFGGLLGLGSLVYDVFPLYLFFLGYGLVCKRRLKLLLLSSFCSAIVYAGFLLLQVQVLGQRIDDSNSRLLTGALLKVLDMAISFDLRKLYLLSISFARVLAGSLASAFFILPLVPAVWGMLRMRGGHQAVAAHLLVLPAVASIAVLHFGESKFGAVYVAQQPRLLYGAYLGVYLLAAIGLAQLARGCERTRCKAWARWIPWTCLLLVCLLTNLDVFGYPIFYFYFYWGSGVASLLSP